MPLNGFSVGRDLTFTLVGPTGILTLSGITEYDPKPNFTDLVHKGQDGTRTHAAVPDGWTITFKVDRNGPELDDFFAAAEDAYFNGTPLPSGSMLETIQEVDGSVSQYRYETVSLKFDGAGTWKGDALVQQSLVANATRRKKVA